MGRTRDGIRSPVEVLGKLAGQPSALWLLGKLLWDEGFNTERLPQLAADSPLLARLKSRLARLKAHQPRTQVESELQRTPLLFYQGDWRDFVVRGIDTGDATTTAWMTRRAEVVHTNTGHTHTVSDAGTRVGGPTFPTEINRLRAEKHLNLMPNYRLFPFSTQGLSEDMIARQAEVVRGIDHFAQEHFSKAYAETADFLAHVLKASGRRSDWVDKTLFEDLLRNLEHATADAEFARFVARLVSRRLARYSTDHVSAELSYGHRSRAAVLLILQVTVALLKKVESAVTINPALEAELSPYASVHALKAVLLMCIERFLNSPYDESQIGALNALSALLRERPNDLAFGTARTQLRVSDWVERNRHAFNERYLAASVVFSQAGLASDMYRHDAVAGLGRKMPWYGRERTIASTIGDAELFKQISIQAKAHPAHAATFAPLLTDIARNSKDLTGTIETSKQAARAFSKNVVQNPGLSEDRRHELSRTFKSLANANRSSDPGVYRAMNRALAPATGSN